MNEITPKTILTKKKWMIIIVNGLLILCVAGGIVWGISTYFNLGSDLYTNDAQVEEYINPVNTRVAGYIRKVYYQEHQLVRKGDTLVSIDDREYRIEVESAEADYQSALATEVVAASTAKTASSNISVAASNIDVSRSRLHNAEKNLNRCKNLLAEGAATQQQYDQERSDYDALLFQTNALIEQKATAALSADESSKKIAVDAAGIQRTRAALALAKLNLSYTVVTAPYTGYTGRRIIQEGQLLQSGQNLLSFVRNDDKWIVANYTETQLPGLHIGTRVRLRIDGLGNREVIGEVTAISEATGSRYSGIPLDNSTGNFVKVKQRVPVRIEILRTADGNAVMPLLKAGMNVEVRLVKNT